MGRVKKQTRGQRNIAWIEKHCVIPEGKFVGQKVKLSPFQKKLIRKIYDSPTRRVIISFGRKNAKTTLSAFLCLLHLVGPEARPNSQLYSAAMTRDQASILFDLMCKTARQSATLEPVVSIRESAKQMFCPELGTLYRALSADASSNLGLSPVFVIHDELGQVVGPRSNLYEALETACSAQEEPLSIVISTQATNDGDLLSMLIDDALAGHDPETKVMLYTAPEDIDPFSVKAIRAANPAFDYFMNQKEVKKMAADAKRMSARESSYRNLVLNQRVSKESAFVAPSVWKANTKPIRDADFTGPIFAGLDLSKTTDLTALVYIGQGKNGQWSARSEFWSPKEGVEERSRADRVPYDLWAKQGYLTLTPGRTVDYEFVARRLIWLCEKHDVQAIMFDRWKIPLLKAELKPLGYEDLPLFEHGQGYKDMTPALEVTEKELLNANIRTGDNPVLNFCASNAVVEIDAAECRKLTKKKSTGRIDGMISLVMALHATAKEVEEEPEVEIMFA